MSVTDHSESFRNDLAVRLAEVLPPNLFLDALSAVDKAAADYDIRRRPTDIIAIGGIPQVVVWYLQSKTVENMSPGTIYQYQRQLIRFFDFVQRPVQAITANDIRAYLADFKMQHGVSDATLDGTRRVLNAFFSWMVDNDYLNKNPVAKIAKIKYQPAQRVPLTPFQLEQLRDNCRTPKEKALIEIFYSTGCRVSEVAAMNLSDLDWHNRSIVVRHGKGNKYRVVFFSSRAEFLLRKYLQTRKDDREPLFLADRMRNSEGRMSARCMQLLIKKIRRREPIGAKCTPHVLRHTMATAGLRAGMPLPDLQALLGHAKPETTMIYAHINLSDLQQAHSKAYAG